MCRLALWNFALLLFSFIGTYRAVPHLLYNMMSRPFSGMICAAPSQTAKPMAKPMAKPSTRLWKKSPAQMAKRRVMFFCVIVEAGTLSATSPDESATSWDDSVAHYEMPDVIRSFVVFFQKQMRDGNQGGDVGGEAVGRRQREERHRHLAVVAARNAQLQRRGQIEVIHKGSGQ